MWSHYTFSHQGIRLHFDSEILKKNNPDWTTERIIYSEKRAIFSKTIDIYNNEKLYKEKLKETLLTKSTSWKYENEYRAFTEPRHCKETIGNESIYYTRQFNADALLRIDFGACCKDETLKDIQEIVKNKKEYAHVELYKAATNPKEFKLDYTPIK